MSLSQALNQFAQNLGRYLSRRAAAMSVLNMMILIFQKQVRRM